MGQLVVLSGAIRDEGASYHYLPPAREVIANPLGVYTLVDMLKTTESLIWLGKPGRRMEYTVKHPIVLQQEGLRVAWWWKWKLLA